MSVVGHRVEAAGGRCERPMLAGEAAAAGCHAVAVVGRDSLRCRPYAENEPEESNGPRVGDPFASTSSERGRRWLPWRSARR